MPGRNKEIHDEQVLQLAALLEQCDLTDSLKNSITQLSHDLRNQALNSDTYLNHREIAAAIKELQINNQWLIPTLCQIWWNQPATFSGYESILLIFTGLALLTAAILSRELVVIFQQGKPKLQVSGSAIQDYCTTGLSNRIGEICLGLPDKQTAIFDMNIKTRNLPNFQGNVSDPLHGPVPMSTLQSIPSWINSLGWITYLTCSVKNNFLNLTGHFYIDSLSTAESVAKNGFPVITTGVQMPFSPFMIDIIKAGMTAFFGLFCIMIQNGGYSTILRQDNSSYGHFDGFEETAKEFESNVRLFTGIYAGITGLTILIMSGIFMNKAYSKWQDSLANREAFGHAREAHSLFEKLRFGFWSDANDNANGAIGYLPPTPRDVV